MVTMAFLKVKEIQMLIAILSWAGNEEIDMDENAGDTIKKVYKKLVDEGELMGDLL